MKKMMFVAAVAVVTVGKLTAVTVGPEWCVAYPEKGSPDVNRALRVAAEEVRNDINEATGLKLAVVPASQAKAPAIYIGAEFAEKAGFGLSDLKWHDNVVAERGGSIYLFGNGRTSRGQTPRKPCKTGLSRCLSPNEVHRRASAEDVKALREAGYEVWTLAGGEPGDAVLFDSSHGDGETAFRRGPWRTVLAGGISAENIAEALALGPDVVDVSGSLETSPGRKDISLLDAFLAAFRKIPS